MAKQTIDITTPYPGWTGDPNPTAFAKVNANFDELYALTGSIGTIVEDVEQLKTEIEEKVDTALQDVDEKVTQAEQQLDQAIAQIPAQVDTAIAGRIPGKNLLINGSMRVRQYGGSGNVNNQEVFGPDRWKLGCSGGVACNWGVGSSPLGTTGHARFFLGYNVVAGASAWVGQKVEGVLTIHGEVATLSFLMRSTPAGKKVGVRLVQNFGSGGSPSPDVVTEVGTITLGANFETHSITFNVPSVIGKTLGSNGRDSLYIVLDLSGAGHGGQLAGQVGLFEFTEAQLEAGSTATGFEAVSLAVETENCERFFQKSYDLAVVPGTPGATNGQDTFFFYGDPNSGRAVGMTSRFATRMRGVPAITIYSPQTGAAGRVRSEAPAGDYVGGVNTPGETGFFLTTVSITTNNTNIRWHWSADAEL